MYTKLPLWFHFAGFPEILLQTLAFSLILHNGISEYKIVKAEKAVTLIKAVSTACLSFIGYTVVSIAFALLSRAKIETDTSYAVRRLGIVVDAVSAFRAGIRQLDIRLDGSRNSRFDFIFPVAKGAGRDARLPIYACKYYVCGKE